MPTFTCVEAISLLLQLTTMEPRSCITIAIPQACNTTLQPTLTTCNLTTLFRSIPSYQVIPVTASTVESLKSQLVFKSAELVVKSADPEFRIAIVKLYTDTPSELTKFIKECGNLCHASDTSCIFEARLVQDHPAEEELNVSHIAESSEYAKASDLVLVPNNNGEGFIILKQRYNMKLI